MQSSQIEMIDAVLMRVYGTTPDHLPTDAGFEFLLACADVPALRKVADEYLVKLMGAEMAGKVKIRFEP